METAELAALFRKAGFGEPEVVGYAPGRVNVIGEHVDYNGGLVLPAAIDRWVQVALRRREDRQVRLVSAQAPDDPAAFSLDDPLVPVGRRWHNYPKGVIACLREEGVEAPGFDAVVSSTVPVGGGLSSSAALEAVFGKAILALNGQEMDPLRLAKVCQQAEHRFAGVPCGLMDQAAVILCEEGKLLLLDCLDDSFTHARFDDPDWVLLIINSCVSHELSDGGYAARRDACHEAARRLGVGTLRELPLEGLEDAVGREELDEEMRRYTRHVVTEVDRTRKMVVALRERDYAAAGRLLNAGHASLRDDYRVSCPELDFIAQLAQGLEGVAGCRLTGGGFGGSAIALARRERADEVAREVGRQYQAAFGIEAKRFVTRPMGGARAWRL